ncbi:MAG: hypothetical protein AAFU49_16265 [Pseudomonadota bacterium]
MAGHNDSLGVKLVRWYDRLSKPEPSFACFELSAEVVNAWRCGMPIEEIFVECDPFLTNHGRQCSGSAIELAKELVDDLRGWNHERETRNAEANSLGAVHFLDSVIVPEKAERPRSGCYVVPASRGSSGGEG